VLLVPGQGAHLDLMRAGEYWQCVRPGGRCLPAQSVEVRLERELVAAAVVAAVAVAAAETVADAVAATAADAAAPAAVAEKEASAQDAPAAIAIADGAAHFQAYPALVVAAAADNAAEVDRDGLNIHRLEAAFEATAAVPGNLGADMVAAAIGLAVAHMEASGAAAFARD